MKLSPTTRRLIAISVFLIAAIFATIGFSNSSSSMSMAELILSIVGAGTWGLAKIHKIAFKPCSKIPEIENENNCHVIPISRHYNMNSKLHTLSSTCYLINNLMKITSPSAAVIMKIIGALFWLKSSIYTYKYSRELDDLNNLQVQNRNNKSKANTIMIADIDYFIAALSYSIPTFLEADTLRYPEYIYWLGMSFHDATCSTIRNPNVKFECSSYPEAILELPPPIWVIETTPPSSIVIKVMDEKNEREHNAVAAQRVNSN